MQLNEFSSLSKNEEIKLIKLIKAGDEGAREQLILSNLKLVHSIVSSYQQKGLCFFLEEEDLFQEGCIGLMNAITVFDENRGIVFSTFAFYHIKKTILKSFNDKSRAIRLPANIGEGIYKINKFSRFYFKETGYLPDYETISENINISVDKIKKYQVFFETATLFSLDKEVLDDSLVGIIDNSTIEKIEQIIERDYIINYLSFLSDRETDIFLRRNGFYGYIETLNEVGEIYGLSRERVRQIEFGINNKLEKKLKIFGFNV